MNRRWIFIPAIGSVVLAAGLVGCQHKPPRSPKILGSQRPLGNVQAPPVGVRTPIAVPSAPVATPTPVVPVVPVTPAVPMEAPPPALVVPAQPAPPAAVAAPPAVVAPPNTGEYRVPVPRPVIPDSSTPEPTPSGSEPGPDPFLGVPGKQRLQVDEPGAAGVR